MRLTNSQQDVLRQLLTQQCSKAEMARQTGIPVTTIKDFFLREQRPQIMGYVQTVAASTPPQVIIDGQLLHQPEPALVVRPLEIEMPPAITETTERDGVITALLYGDTHFPNHDPRALAIVMKIAERLQPNLIAHMGDLLDCYSLSRFDKNPTRMETLQDEIDMARAHLAQMRLLSPNSRMVLLEGNHEDRLRRTLWNMPGTAAALTHLNVFRDALTWPTLLDVASLGVEFVPYAEQSKKLFLPKWILKHGNVVRRHSAATARAEWERYSRSGSSGHTHRLGQYYHNDHNGSHCWVETGCTCILNPEYLPDPDWQQGCVVLEFDVTTGAFNTDSVFIHNGRAVWRGTVYQV